MKRVIFGWLGSALLVMSGGLAARQLPDVEPQAEFGEWSTAVNLGESINTSFRETGASISRDGLSLYFDSSNDLYVSRRRAVDLPWETPAPLDTLNSTENDA